MTSSVSSSATQKLGVLFVHSATLPPLGADTWVHAQIMRALNRRAHVVHAACVRGPEGRPTPTYEVLRRIPDLHLLPIDLGPELSARTSLRGKFAALFATLPAAANVIRLARYVRRHDISIIHTSDRPRDAFACVLLARLTRAKCVVHAHVAYGEWMSRPLKWSLKRADAMIAISQFVAGSLESSGRDEHSIYVVLNALDGRNWVPGAGRAEARHELGVADSDPIVVTVCRLFPGKGPAELIRALALVRHEEPEAKLVIVGSDMTPDGSYTRELSSLVSELGLAEHVIFTGRRSDVPRLMAASDVFAMPSFEEPFGLVFLEAMAMELPVVALDNGGTPEVVEDGRSGLLTRPGDIEGLAARLLRLLRDPELRRRMGVYGRRQVDDRFTVERMADDVARAYELIALGNVVGHDELLGAGHASSHSR
jgi:glycosyltransferase involved in cell wall biosynthesis